MKLITLSIVTLLLLGCATTEKGQNSGGLGIAEAKSGARYKVIEMRDGSARKCEVEKVDGRDQCREGITPRTYSQFTSWALSRRSREEGLDFYFRAPTEPKSPYYFTQRGKALHFHIVHLNPNVRVGDCEVSLLSTKVQDGFDYYSYSEVCKDLFEKVFYSVSTEIKRRGTYAEIVSVKSR